MTLEGEGDMESLLSLPSTKILFFVCQTPSLVLLLHHLNCKLSCLVAFFACLGENYRFPQGAHPAWENSI